MKMSTQNDGYDPADNGIKCYNLAIRTLRLNGIREGKIPPFTDDPEEMEAARQGGLHVIEAQAHRRSA